jgi:predicted enzyme related to lactoylglutathione lyase
VLQKVAFTMFAVEDTARARAFYEGVLGLRVGSHSESGVWTEYDLPGGGCLALFRRPDGKGGRPGSGGASIAFEVADLDAAVAAVKAAGGTVRAEGITSPVCRMTMVEDTEGNAIILHKLHPR